MNGHLKTTLDREGFIHPVAINGGMEQTVIEFIIRDHITTNLAKHENRLEEILNKTLSNHPKLDTSFVIKETISKHEGNHQGCSICY